jgi:UDP-N-acetylmuramate dehydrogenase
MTADSDSLAQRLAEVPDLGVERGAALAPHTTFRIGGPAQWLVEVPTLRGLRALLAAVRTVDAPFWLLGLGSNVLIPDRGLEGVVVRLTGYFRRVRVSGSRVSAGAAVSLAQLARRMSARGLVGLEALSGFPSTVGGAVYMNAGCAPLQSADLSAEA